MPPCFCFCNPPSTSITKFISDQPFLSMLETKCKTMKDLKTIHAHLIKTGLAKNIIVASRVLAFCATSLGGGGDINYAYLVFANIEKPNLFTWNTIIRGFSQSSAPEKAISLFVDLLVNSNISPERLTYPSVFKAYTQLGLARDGAQLHGRVVKLGLEFDPFIRNSVIHMYANCGLLGDARKLFDEDKDLDVVAWNSMIMGLAKCGEIDESSRLFGKMPLRNEVSWNSMMSGYVRNGKWMEAFDLFGQMQEEKIMPSEFTLVSLLNASAKLGALEQGEWIHDYITKHKVDLNVIIITALVDMYYRCGEIEMARQVFEAVPRKGVSCWNSMMLGLALNGFEDEVIELFSRLESSHLKPDSVSFIGVLTACNHSGQVDKAKEYFSSMKETYKIQPSVEHYGCMVDVLGRAGRVEEAAELIRSMPMSPDPIIWGSLLAACRNHQNVDIAKWAAENLIELDENETSGYVLMSNVYAALGHFEKAMQQRIVMKNRQIEKQPGCSLIEVDGEVHEFAAGGMLHSQFRDMDFSLNEPIVVEI